jgi:hypothetical protein
LSCGQCDEPATWTERVDPASSAARIVGPGRSRVRSSERARSARFRPASRRQTRRPQSPRSAAVHLIFREIHRARESLTGPPSHGWAGETSFPRSKRLTAPYKSGPSRNWLRALPGPENRAAPRAANAGRLHGASAAAAGLQGCRNAEAARIAILGQCVLWASSATAARSFVHTRNFLGCAAFVGPVMALASAAVHSAIKKQSYITSFPGQPTSDARHSLQFAMDIWQRFQMPTPAPPPDGAEWIGIGGARLSLVCFVPHNWPRRRIGATRKLVGVAGFEPATPSSRTRCASRRPLKNRRFS